MGYRYRTTIEQSLDKIDMVMDSICYTVKDIQDIVRNIPKDNLDDKIIDKLDDIEYVVSELLHEIE